MAEQGKTAVYMNQVGTDDDQTFASFKQMYKSLLALMRYTPSHATWHRINHWLPCIGLRPYSYNHYESLELCSRVESALDSLNSVLVDDLFLIGQYKTCTRTQRRLYRRTPAVQQRVVAEDNDDDSSSSGSSDILINDVMETDAAAWADDASENQSDEDRPDETGLVNPWEEDTNDATDLLSGDWAVVP